MDIIFWDVLMIQQIFFHKWNEARLLVINMVYICELPIDLRLTILGNHERSGKSENFIES